MMVFLQSYVRRGHRTLQQLAANQRVRTVMVGGAYALAGFLLSAASLGNHPQPLVLGLLCAAPPGWSVVLLGLGGAAGYLTFWGTGGAQALAWVAVGLVISAAVSGRPVERQFPVLIPVLAGTATAVCGAAFAIWAGDDTGLPMYLLWILLAFGSAMLFNVFLDHRDPVCDWVAEGVAVLALAQVLPIPWLSLGYLAAGIIGAAEALPGVALAGLALDLAQVTKIPMTGVLAVAFLLRMLPGKKKWAACLAPVAAFAVVSAASGVWDLAPLPGLAAGGAAALLLPKTTPVNHRRGSTGLLQVRLELVSGVLHQTEQLLRETHPAPVDADALIRGCAQRACGSCPCRKGCQERNKAASLTGDLLDRPLVSHQDLPFACRRSGRLWAELRRGQEQLRTLRGEHRRREECRQAVVWQYRFLSEYLQELSDDLASKHDVRRLRFQPEVAAVTAGRESANGDKCIWFSGTGGRYYVLLCDGMGTGMGAEKDALTATEILHRLLQAGFPAEHALGSLNSLCALRGEAGAVTVDLAEFYLDSGKCVLYKWGAAPSLLLMKGGTEKIGTAAPPPGLSVTDTQAVVERLSLRRGEMLVLLSDGAGGEDALGRVGDPAVLRPQELAERMLSGGEAATDDATVAVVRLLPATG